MDLSQLCKSHFIRLWLFIKSEMHLHRISLHLWLLRWKISKATGPVDFQEFDILMNWCIFLKETTIHSSRHTINWIAAVKSRSFSESTGLSGTDSLCPQGCASFQQPRKKSTMVLTEAADNTGFRWLVPCISDQSHCESAIHIHSNHTVSIQSRFFKTKTHGRQFCNNLHQPRLAAACADQNAVAKVSHTRAHTHTTLVQ